MHEVEAGPSDNRSTNDNSNLKSDTSTSQLPQANMDPLQHISQKLSAERTYQSLRQQQPTPPTTAPPPYTPSESNDADTDTDSEDEDEAARSPSPVKLTINAAHRIQGSNNLVPTSPTPLADATKFSAVLLAAMQQLNAAAAAETSTGTARRALKVDLTINCGITVIGDRNVVGNVGLKAKSSLVANDGAGPANGNVVAPAHGHGSPSAVVVGAKRKAGDV
ncbi:hypothetical protein LTR78_007478 [Recurvomyces mirabilis]|uniref:Uncharacterized protein n=2 Tax=Recurvomyces mirabilis TaxID=574656 RepID=A0AAE0WHE8_9PEZI|nr:hypothetical protein LTR78_007478 [Recurvomyces mirabilis]